MMSSKMKAAFAVKLCDHDFHSINIILLNDFCVKATLAIENCVIGQPTWLLKINFFISEASFGC